MYLYVYIYIYVSSQSSQDVQGYPWKSLPHGNETSESAREDVKNWASTTIRISRNLDVDRKQ